MSVVLLKELYSEVSRLYIAGSDLAAGDFRLKRMLPGLQQAGEKAPVFRKLGEGVQGLVEPAGQEEGSSAARLQELTLLLSSILHTQGSYAPEGELRELDSQPVTLGTEQPYRRVAEVIEALSTTGSGRHEIVIEAFKDGLFQDLRLVQHAVRALHDPYAELADYARDTILPAYGRTILPLLRERFDRAGGKGDARTIEVLAKLAETDKEWTEIYEAADQGSSTVRVAAIPHLGTRPAYEADLIRWAGDSKKAVRAAAYLALPHLDSEAAHTKLYEAMGRADAELASDALARVRSHPIASQLAKDAGQLLEELTAGGKAKEDSKAVAVLQDKLPVYWQALQYKDDPESKALVHQLLEAAAPLHKLNLDHILHGAAYVASESPSLDVLTQLRRLEKLNDSYLRHSYQMARQLLTPAEIYEAFSGYDRGAYKDELVELMETELVTKQWQAIEATWEGGPGYGYVTTYKSEDEVAQSWDFRWLPWAISRKKPILTAMLASRSRAGTAEEVESMRIAEILLLEELERTFKDFQDDFSVIWEGLRRCGTELGICQQAMLKGLERPKRLRYYLSNDVFYELKRLPASYLERLGALQGRADREVAVQLQNVMDSISEVQT
ncbi:hypothetical protein [Paenibacillus daejeonensis]|uniref:hypothetical protein n=1 Tax=Paenibacillus daejeonensis TaxID=135193 RepID=UPI0003829BB7|nr:hypothetical protein [Paenibacillus daejeonensis]